MVSKTKHQFFKDGFQKLVARWWKCTDVRGDFVEKYYAALKTTDVGIFFLLKCLFPFSFYLSVGKTYQPALV